MWGLIVSVPDHCLSFYFTNVYMLFDIPSRLLLREYANWAIELIILCVSFKWAEARQNQQNHMSDQYQPEHSPSLFRVFTVRIKKHSSLSYPSIAPRRLWSDWADAQARPGWSESLLGANVTLLVMLWLIIQCTKGTVIRSDDRYIKLWLSG